MDSNRDEAERCINFAISALKHNNPERAEKFLKKAHQLYPSAKSKELLERLNINKTNDCSKDTSKIGEVYNRSGSSKTSKSSEDKYTKEQLDIVHKIKLCKDYYEILNITKEATDTEIKKAYKKLALQLHPDKNHAPGAIESFKMVGTAAAILTDPEKRKTYDLYGIEEKINNNTHRQHTHNNTNHEYEHAYDHTTFESDFGTDELFNMFFSNNFTHQRSTAYQRRYQARQETLQQPSIAFGLILVLIVISMLSSFFTSDPIYSLTQSSRYPVRKATINMNIPYYVRDRFESEYQGSLARLENSVEEDYVSTMIQNCNRERAHREVMIARARTFGSKHHVEQAQIIKTPSCENMAKLRLNKFLP